MKKSLGEIIHEKSVEWLVAGVLGIVVVLVFVIWGAVPTDFRQAILDAADKRVLWALLGLLGFILVGETVYIVVSTIRNRKVLHHYCGALWNSESEVFCPKDETPLFQNGITYSEEFPQAKGVEIFQCPKCDNSVIFKDTDGSHISFEEAKKGFLTSRTLKTKKKLVAPPSTTSEGFDKSTLLILKEYANTNRPYLATENLAPILSNLKPVEISYRLDVLNQAGLIINAGYQMAESKNPCYRLTANGREYVVKNGIL